MAFGRSWTMDDQQAFERQLEQVLRDVAGPPRPVDASSITRAVATGTGGPARIGARWSRIEAPAVFAKGGYSMFTTLKLAAAAAALAIVGSVLALSVGPPTGDQSGPGALSAPTVQNAHGSIWLERHDDSPGTFYVLHGDGLMTGFNRDLGIGVGQWLPIDEGSIEAQLSFTGSDSQYLQLEPGTADLHFVGTLDDAGDHMTLTYDDNGLGMTTTSVERQKMAPMPPEAETVTPPDTGWLPATGIHSHGLDESGVTLEEYGGRPNMTLEHSDGTWVSINSWVGPGVGLITAPDEYHGILTAWWVNDDPDTTLPLVGQVSVDPETGAVTNAYGDSEGFVDSAPMERQELGEVPEPDEAWWPSLGSIWVEAREGGPDVMTALHADGTVLTIDPYRGVGVGSWRPTGVDTATVTIDYYDVDLTHETVSPGPATLRGELRFAEDGELATLDASVENRPRFGGEAWEDTVSATLEREPFAG
jgi:hypothetical protein